MTIFKVEFTVFTMMYVIAITMSADLEIIRIRPTVSDGWKKGTDSFKIPSSLCGEDGSTDTMNCERFNAKVISQNGDQCSCSCSNENATLMFENDQWSCRNNAEVRTVLGSERKAYFFRESQDNELRMLKINDYRKLYIHRTFYNCAVDVSSSRYIRCNGSEGRLFSSPFRLQRRTSQSYPYYVKVENGISNTDLLRGRIIKLRIKCSNGNGVLLFKYEGSISCSISAPTVQSPSVTAKPLNTTLKLTSPRTVSRTTLTKTDTKPTQMTSDSVPVSYASVLPTVPESPRTVFLSPPTVTESPPMVSYSIPTVSKVPPTVSEVEPTGSDAPRTTLVPQSTASDTTIDLLTNAPAARPSSSRERSTGNKSSSPALIAGITASVLVIVIIVVFLVYRHRYSKKKPYLSSKTAESKETVMTSPQTRSANELDDENVYKELEFGEPAVYTSRYQVSYCNRGADSTDGDSNRNNLYVPLNIIPEGQNIYGHRNNQETANDTKSPENGPISVEQCVYGLMEELSVASLERPVRDTENETHPVYNVVEPYFESSEGPDDYGTMYTEGPVYSALKGQINGYKNGTQPMYKEPIYNTLEGHANEALYNNLENPYFEGAEGPGENSATSPIYNTLEDSCHENANERNNLETTIINEPIYNVVEEEPSK